MVAQVLDDPELFPDDAVLTRVLGKAKHALDTFVVRLREEVAGASIEWRYYKDGKAWLGKVARGKKTIGWVSVGRASFKVTFYFNANSERALLALPLSREATERYHSRENVGKLKPLVFEIRTERALDEVVMVAKLKLKS
ncbi:MAG: DUF3788 family protein [Polyangiaceae bacterium]